MFESIQRKTDIRRSGSEIIHQLIVNVESQLRLHGVRVFTLSFIAGALICYGAALGVKLSVGLSSEGAEHFMVSFGFLAGLSTVALSGSLLNSVINVEYSVFLLHGLNKGYPGDLFLKLGGNWILVNLGNFIGSLTTAGLITYSQVFTRTDKDRLEVILEAKLKNADDGIEGICIVLVSGMLANWIVGHAIMNAASSRSTVGKVAGIFFCVFMFAALGLQHGAANMGQIFLGLLADLDAVSWTRSMVGNIIPSTIGNTIGEFVFVGFPFWYSLYFDKYPNNRSVLIKTGQANRVEKTQEMVIDMGKAMESRVSDTARIVIKGVSIRQEGMSDDGSLADVENGESIDEDN